MNTKPGMESLFSWQCLHSMGKPLLRSPVLYKPGMVSHQPFVILALGRSRQEGQKVRVILGYVENSWEAWDT